MEDVALPEYSRTDLVIVHRKLQRIGLIASTDSSNLKQQGSNLLCVKACSFSPSLYVLIS